jgi:hypothetical protein
MYREDNDGNHFFEGVRSQLGGQILEGYVFEKKNYEAHKERHRIEGPAMMAEIDATIFQPDLITIGPKTKIKRNFYRVRSFQNGPRGEKALKLWRVHSIRIGKRDFIIATAFETITSPEFAVHYLEKMLWRKQGSLV